MTQELEKVLALALDVVEPRSPQRVPLIEAVGRVRAGSKDRVNAALVEQLARKGRDSVEVIARPCLVVITIGDDDEQGVIGLTLNALAREAGIVDTHLFQADAVLEDLAFVFDHVAKADLVLFTGGAELGIEAVRHHGARVLFQGELGGEPLLLAAQGPQMIFGVPASSGAARESFERIVIPIARRMGGQIDPVGAAEAQVASA